VVAFAATCSAVRPNALTPRALQSLAVLLGTATPALRNQALLVAEAATQYASHLAATATADAEAEGGRGSLVTVGSQTISVVCDAVVPALISLALSETGDTRAYALKTAADATAFLLSDRLVLSVRGVVPLAVQLLDDGEPIPRYPHHVFVVVVVVFLL
jgi:hypothetical protein